MTPRKLTLVQKTKIQEYIFRYDCDLEEISAKMGIGSQTLINYCDELINTISKIVDIEMKRIKDEKRKVYGPPADELMAKNKGAIVMTPVASQRADNSAKREKPKARDCLYSPKTGLPLD